MATQTAIGAHVSTSGGIYTALERAEAIEAEAIQIFPSAPQMWRPTKHTPEALTRFRELHAASTVGEVWLHNIYLANLASDDPELLEKSIRSVVNALTVADAIEAQGVVLHTGSHKGRGLDAVASRVCDALARILDEAPGKAVLALENAAGHGGVIGRSFAELGLLLGSVRSPRLQVCVDTCHAFAAGYDIATPAGIEIAMAEFDSEIGLEHLAVVHANDSKVPLGGERDRHENIGEGFIGLDGFRTILASPAFQGRAFLLEVPGFPDAAGKTNGPDLENVHRLKAIRDEVAAGGKPSRAAKRERAAKPAARAGTGAPVRRGRATPQPDAPKTSRGGSRNQAGAKQAGQGRSNAKARKPGARAARGATKGGPSAGGRPSRGTRPPSGGSRRADRS